MTATITPPFGVPLLARFDPALRLQDYEQSLKFYLPLLNTHFHSIIFAENSNSDVSSLQKIVDQAGMGDLVEFIVFNGLDHPPAYGRAYGEFKLIDHVMQSSEVTKKYDEASVFWKVTGRYIVRNLDQILNHRPSNFDIFCNLRKIPKHWADMFLIAWTLKGYESFLHRIHHKLIADENCLVQPEEVFIDLLDAASKKEIKLAPRFIVTPLVDGVRGSDNQNYSENRNLWKFYTRNLACCLLPLAVDLGS